MNDLLMIMEWVTENYEIIELIWDKGCHCENFTIYIEYYDYMLTIEGIAYFDGDVSNVIRVHNDYNDTDVEYNEFVPSDLDTIKKGFIKMIDDDMFCGFDEE